MKYTKKIAAGKSVDKKTNEVTKAWPEGKITVDGTELLALATDPALKQHLIRYIKLMSQHDASSCHRGGRKTGNGPGWKWDAEASTLTLTSKVWEERESGADKRAAARAEAEAKVDAKIAAGQLKPAMRKIVLEMMGFGA